MIDIKVEKLLSLAEAAALLPPGRNGRPHHPSTLLRGIKSGVRGHKLEALRSGGRWLTSVEAVQRWLERQTAEAIGEPLYRTSLAARRAAERAGELLEKAGC